MRVETVAICQLQALIDVPEFRAERGGARHGRINVKPDALFLRDPSDFRQRVEGVRGGGPHSGADDAGDLASLPVASDLRGQSIRAHGQASVNLDEAQVFVPEPGDPHGFFDGGVSLGRSIGDQFSLTTLLIASVACGALASS